MRISQTTAPAVALTLLLLGGTASKAGSITLVPPGLNPGDQYRLAFLTSTGINGTSAAINTYNNLVNTLVGETPALLALGGTWSAIATTVNEAIQDTLASDPGVRIFNLAGDEVATDATHGAGGLFSCSIMNPINVRDTGETLSSAVVWTGSTCGGGNNPSDALGTTAFGGAEIFVGYAGPAYRSGNWLSAFLYGSSAVLPVYGISSVLTAPANTPEPSTLGLSMLGAALLLAVARNWRPRADPPGWASKSALTSPQFSSGRSEM